MGPVRKRRVHRAFEWRCVYCARNIIDPRRARPLALAFGGARPGAAAEALQAPNLATVDHIVPVALGGTDALENLLSSCRACNTERGVVRFAEYVQARAEREPGWLERFEERLRAGVRNLLLRGRS